MPFFSLSKKNHMMTYACIQNKKEDHQLLLDS